MYRIHGYSQSPNSYKVDLLFHQAGLDLEWSETDISKGQSHTPSFRTLNPFELTPVLEDKRNGRVFVESNAILWHFAKSSPFEPKDALAEYETLKWMFFEQNLLEPNIGRARRLMHLDGLDAERAGPQLTDRQKTAAAALKLLEQAVGARQFLVNDTYGIADIAVFAYTHVAPQAGVSLAPFANIRRWIANVQSTPRFKTYPPARESAAR